MGKRDRNRARWQRAPDLRESRIESAARHNSSAAGTRHRAVNRSCGDGPKAERTRPKQRRRFQREVAQLNGAKIDQWACLAVERALHRRVKKLKRTCR